MWWLLAMVSLPAAKKSLFLLLKRASFLLAHCSLELLHCGKKEDHDHAGRCSHAYPECLSARSATLHRLERTQLQRPVPAYVINLTSIGCCSPLRRPPRRRRPCTTHTTGWRCVRGSTRPTHPPWRATCTRQPTSSTASHGCGVGFWLFSVQFSVHSHGQLVLWGWSWGRKWAAMA